MQLKIIASVKVFRPIHYFIISLYSYETGTKDITVAQFWRDAQATSTADSYDSDPVLVKNAQNLMDAVQRMVRASEAASIKIAAPSVSPGAPGSVNIQWRKRASRTSKLFA